jgi:hypothetical protein
MTYPTAANLKDWMGVSGNTKDTQLGWALAGAIDYVEQYCNRVFVAATATRQFPVRYPFVGKHNRQLNFYEDLAAITSITNGDGVVITDYYTLPNNAPYIGVFLNASAGIAFTDNGDGSTIAVAGSWGYSASCPSAIFTAVMEIAKQSFNSAQQGVGGDMASASRGSGLLVNPGQFPKMITDVLNSYKRGGL